MNKIKEEQLNSIREQQNQLNATLNEIGYLEVTKHGLLHKFAGLSQDTEDYKKELEKEYGHININLEDGTYTEIKEDESNKKD